MFKLIWKRQKFVVWEWVKSLPYDKILDMSKFKAFAHDEKKNVAKIKDRSCLF